MWLEQLLLNSIGVTFMAGVEEREPTREVPAVSGYTGERSLTECGVQYAEIENNASIVRVVVKNPCLLLAKFHMVLSVRIVRALVYVRVIAASKRA